MSILWQSGGNTKKEGRVHNCSFSKLVKLLDKKLTLDERLEVLFHIDDCDICRDAVYHIAKDRDEAFFVFRALKRKKLSVA